MRYNMDRLALREDAECKLDENKIAQQRREPKECDTMLASYSHFNDLMANMA
jgi:hypothetical protein